jgi:hypothetical protein
MLSLIYSSVATDTFGEADLAGLLAQSRTANERNDVTGMLLFRNGYFLQVLEGPDAAVREKMAVIKTDPRHTKVTMLLEDLDDVPGYRTAFTDVESVTDGQGSSASPALRELIRWFQARPERLQPAD